MTKQLALASPRYWPAWLLLFVFWLITRLPFRCQFVMGKYLGLLLYRFPTRFKQITQTNIKLCFPELSSTQQAALVKNNFASLGIGLIETAMAWWLPDRKLKSLYTLKGLEHAEQAFAKGKGIILLSPHFISLEMIGRLMGMHYSFAVMYRPHKKAFVAYIHQRFREKYKLKAIARHRVRELLRTLNQNQAIWYAYDIDAGEKGSVFAPFFNIPTASLTAVSRLVQMTGATVIPISYYRNEKQFSYEINLGAPLTHFPSGDYVTDATRLNTFIEAAIRKKPDQYVWQYKRFKTRPMGEERFYG